ncbi:MAG: hypothetical protein ACOYI5_08980 [Christensenellales bacterium]|jgi:hypothetical protein
MKFFNTVNFWETLKITGMGMLGIFAVMILIYIVIIVLSKVTKDN